jgi:hypothetical protein
VEVLAASWAKPGDIVLLEGSTTAGETEASIDVGTFFSIPLRAVGGFAYVGDTRLTVEGRALELAVVRDGEIG